MEILKYGDLVISDLLMMNIRHAKWRVIVNYDKDEKEWTSQSLHMQEGSNREGWREIVKKATDIEPCMLMMMMMERLYLCTPPSNIWLFTLCTSGLRWVCNNVHTRKAFQDQNSAKAIYESIIAMLPAAFYIKSRGDRRCIDFQNFQMPLSTHDWLRRVHIMVRLPARLLTGHVCRWRR